MESAFSKCTLYNLYLHSHSHITISIISNYISIHPSWLHTDQLLALAVIMKYIYSGSNP